MGRLHDLALWFTGGPSHQYMAGVSCMLRDWPWIYAEVAEDVVVWLAYVAIAVHWKLNTRGLPGGPSRAALDGLFLIFVFCGLSGYIFPALRLWWPAWRLGVLLKAALIVFTVRYVALTRGLRVVMEEMKDKRELIRERDSARDESRRTGLFLNALSHDLRTPIEAIGLNCLIVGHAVDAGNLGEARKALGAVGEARETAETYLDRAMAWARSAAGSEPVVREEFDAIRLLEVARRRFAPIVTRRSITILSQSTVHDLAVRADRVKLDRIVDNLLSNAVKFCGDGGRTVVAAASHRDVLEILVGDDGPGIAPADHERIFREFVQLNNPSRDPAAGFGLGLAISRRYAEEMGGTLGVRSEPGKGATFVLRVPGAVVTDALSRN